MYGKVSGLVLFMLPEFMRPRKMIRIPDCRLPSTKPSMVRATFAGRFDLALRLRMASLLVLCALLTGCEEEQPERIDATYGQAAGDALASVNGTSVFLEMFERSGHNTSIITKLSPRVHDTADVIVWFPASFDPPQPETRRWLEDWLTAKAGRTLLYVGRDYDALPQYWRMVRDVAPEEQQSEIDKRLNLAEFDFQRQHASYVPCEGGDWFRFEALPRGRFQREPPTMVRVRLLEGQPSLLGSVDATMTSIRLYSRLVPLGAYSTWLEGDGLPLVVRRPIRADPPLHDWNLDDEPIFWGFESQTLFVANGSFLLNLPLVNHEHRKLAQGLIDQLDAGQHVMFLETGTEANLVREQDEDQQRNGFEVLGVPPFNGIFLHLAAAGIIFAIASWPVFGRPRTRHTGRHSDFGRHLTALGALLQGTRDADYARRRLAEYHQRAGLEAARKSRGRR